MRTVIGLTLGLVVLALGGWMLVSVLVYLLIPIVGAILGLGSL